MQAPSWDRLRGDWCERLGVKKRRLKLSARLWTWSDFMCPAASQRQPCETCSMARIFWQGEKKSLHSTITAIFLSFFFLRLTPIVILQRRRKRTSLSSGFKKGTIWSCAKYIQNSLNKSQIVTLEGNKPTIYENNNIKRYKNTQFGVFYSLLRFKKQVFIFKMVKKIATCKFCVYNNMCFFIYITFLGLMGSAHRVRLQKSSALLNTCRIAGVFRYTCKIIVVRTNQMKQTRRPAIFNPKLCQSPQIQPINTILVSHVAHE